MITAWNPLLTKHHTARDKISIGCVGMNHPIGPARIEPVPDCPGLWKMLAPTIVQTDPKNPLTAKTAYLPIILSEERIIAINYDPVNEDGTKVVIAVDGRTEGGLHLA